MSIAYYEQDEENSENRLVCPYCHSDVLISEFGELGMCKECFESFPINELNTRESYRETCSKNDCLDCQGSNPEKGTICKVYEDLTPTQDMVDEDSINNQEKKR